MGVSERSKADEDEGRGEEGVWHETQAARGRVVGV